MWNILKKIIALKMAAKVAEKVAGGKKRKKKKGRRTERGFWERRMKKNPPRRGARLAGGILGGLASFATVYAVRALRKRHSTAESFPQSGQAPGRSHIQLQSHPATGVR